MTENTISSQNMIRDIIFPDKIKLINNNPVTIYSQLESDEVFKNEFELLDYQVHDDYTLITVMFTQNREVKRLKILRSGKVRTEVSENILQKIIQDQKGKVWKFSFFNSSYGVPIPSDLTSVLLNMIDFNAVMTKQTDN